MKNILQIPRKELDLFSEQDLDFVYHQEKLKDFIGLPFSIENFKSQIEFKQKLYTNETRMTLTKVLEKRYSHVKNNGSALDQIKHLKNSNAYTVTTGHQLCILGGPLYFFLKIIHVIKLSERLNEHYPNQHFIPVFWMASEDHDHAEMDHLNLFNKTFKWNHEQEGPVGRFTTKNLSSLFEEISILFKDDQLKELQQIFDSFQGKTYGEAFMNWLHGLFSEKGLLIIDGDQSELKQSFAPLMEKELTHEFSNQEIQAVNQKLTHQKRKIQLHSREINLFYIDENERKRIVKEGDDYEIGLQKMNLQNTIKHLNEHPEKFSPNAALRPLYQEHLLPNLCYVGGMAEMHYWSQLKGVFIESDVPFPLIQMRSNLLWIKEAWSKKMKKAKLTEHDLFQDIDALKKSFVEEEDLYPIQQDKLNSGLSEIESSLRSSITNHKELDQWMGSELKKIEKSLDQVKNRINREKKKSFDIELSRVEKIKEALFPNKGLQERHVNILDLTNNMGYRELLNQLFSSIDPLNDGITVVTEKPV
jgi:bacillithiol biosynthesis cysteine-adding enzyme BshC